MMDWKESIQGTIRQWRKIRASIGRGEDVVLLADINAECDLCRAASDVAEDSAHRCESCLGFQEFGNCREADLAMSELVMEKDWDGLRVVVDDFIGALEGLETTKGEPERVPEPAGKR